MKHADIISKLTNRQKAQLLTGKDFWSTLDIPELDIPSAFLSDGPHGVRKQAAASDHLGLNASIPATCFPTASAMACSWNESLGEEMGKALGEEAASQKVNVLLGPGVNMKRNPLCGRNFEYFSEDPYLAGKMAAAYIRGIQSNGISACVKHFAANNQEKRRMVIDSAVDERTLREIYLTAFEIAVKEGKTKAIMSSYNKVNGTYANENSHLLREILRDDWGFEGVVISDWGGCNDRVKGVEAGNELDMPCGKCGIEEVYKALENGTLSSQTVDESLDRLLDLILDTDKVLKTHSSSFDTEAHHQIAEKCAQECIVLLKNNNSVLPLNSGDKVCFIGSFAKVPRFQGAGSSIVNPTKTVNCLDEVKNYPINFIGFAEGFQRYGKPDSKLMKEALDLAAKSDVIVFFAGLDEISEAEGIDRADMQLPANQNELLTQLLALKKKTVVSLYCGSCVELDVVDRADAILHNYLNGQAGAQAFLQVLTGQINPSGKLAECYPYKYEDCPSSDNFHNNDFVIQYREGPFIGYRYYTSADKPVRYPFGFGLSYTSFQYSNMKTDEKGISFTVTNTGSRSGAETAQMYIQKTDTQIIRPVRELKGFRKVFLKPGESRELRIDFDEYTFRIFNPEAGCWQTEDGIYEIKVGASCVDIRLKGEISVEGSADLHYNKQLLMDYFSADVKRVTSKEFEELLGRKVVIPERSYIDPDRKKILVEENTTISDLKYAKGFLGRVFAGGINTAHKFLWKTGKKDTANTLEMGMLHQPMRALAQFGSMSENQLNGMLDVFNGHTIKGLKQFLSKEK